MTSDKIIEMLKDIIDNGAEYECRSICGECDCRRENCDDTCTLTDRLWNKYHLGDEIRNDYEYRKVEKWYVYLKPDGSYILSKEHRTGDAIFDKVLFEGSKEKCEKWIEKHAKKTWLDETFPLGDVVDDMHIEGEKERWGIYNVCKKILKEVDSHKWDYEDAWNRGFEVIEVSDIHKIIKDLGVEV